MRTFIITGGSRGIGRGICRSMAKSGHNIIFTYNTDRSAAEENQLFIKTNFNVECEFIQVKN